MPACACWWSSQRRAVRVRSGCTLLATNVGRRRCLQAVGSECGLISTECGPEGGSIGTRMWARSGDVCRLRRRGLQVATLIRRVYPDKPVVDTQTGPFALVVLSALCRALYSAVYPPLPAVSPSLLPSLLISALVSPLGMLILQAFQPEGGIDAVRCPPPAAGVLPRRRFVGGSARPPNGR